MENLLNGAMNDARNVLLGAIIVTAIAMVLITWTRTRSAVPTLGAFLLGVLVIAGVASYTTIRGVAEDDIDRWTGTTNPPIAGTLPTDE